MDIEEKLGRDWMPTRDSCSNIGAAKEHLGRGYAVLDALLEISQDNTIRDGGGRGKLETGKLGEGSLQAIILTVF